MVINREYPISYFIDETPDGVRGTLNACIRESITANRTLDRVAEIVDLNTSGDNVFAQLFPSAGTRLFASLTAEEQKIIRALEADVAAAEAKEMAAYNRYANWIVYPSEHDDPTARDERIEQAWRGHNAERRANGVREISLDEYLTW